MMKKIKTLAMVSSFAVISLLLLAGCGSEKKYWQTYFKR